MNYVKHANKNVKKPTYFTSRHGVGIMKNIPNEIFPDNLILCGYRGSISHNTYILPTEANSTDDIDLLGVYLAPVEYYIGLGKGKVYRKALERFIGQYDAVFYELKKIINMLLKSNPNVLSLLWLKNEHYIKISPAGQEPINNRDAFLSKKNVYNAFTGYAYGQLKRMTHFERKGYMGEKRKKLVEKYGYDCYDEGTTEFLTDSGWKKFDDVDNDDKLGTVDILSNYFEFQNYINKTDRLYTGSMYIIEPLLNKCIVTPGHNLLISPTHRNPKNDYSCRYEEDKADWNLLPVEEAINGYRSVFHYRRVPIPTNEEYNIEDSYLELAGLYVSDGTSSFYKNGRHKDMRFTQSKANNGFYDVANSLMDIYSIRRYDYDKETIWSLHGNVAHQIYNDFGHHKEKKLPSWCLKLSKRQIEILWRSLMLGDGHNRREYDVYYTTLGKLADDIQAILTVAGIFCVIDGPYPSQTTFGYTEMYRVVRSKLANKIHNVQFSELLLLKHGDKPAYRQGYPIKEIKVVDRRA